jgi:GDP-D-mannose dehydratase
VGLNYKKYLKVDKKLLRSNKTKNLKANLTKSKKILKYKVKTNIHELIKIMMKNELEKYNE